MSVTIQTIPSDPSTGNLNEFFVPTILNFSLEKTSKDRSPDVETDDSAGRQNGGPFLKPVDPHIESNKENPVLQALFGGKSPPGLSQWRFLNKTSINNCHPFKKTELSHDLATDDTPAEIPKSLLKKPSRVKKKISRDEEANVLKEIQVNSDAQKSESTTGSLTSNASSKIKSVSSSTADKVPKFEGACLLNKRKRTNSQAGLPLPRTRLAYVNSQRLIQLRMTVDNAIKNHKIYSMTGCYNSVRNALKQRGWIEKIDSDVKGRRRVNKFDDIGLYDAAFQFVQKNQTVAAMRVAIQTHSGFAHNDQIRYSGQGEAEIMNRMLRNVTEDLCWLSRPFPYYCYKDFDKFEMINRLPRAYFSNKVGLCNSLQQIQWFYESGVCSTQYPRTYNTSVKEEIQAFKDDFRLTACIGLLKWFHHTYNNSGEKAVRAPDGKVDLNVIEFALRRCAEFVKTKQHEDIDIMETQTVWEYQWDNFITQYYKVVNDGQILKDNKEGVSMKAMANNVQSMLNILKSYWPQFDIEGYRNFWIVKPGGRCCGAGIIIKNQLEQILLVVNPNSLKETRYVVQKYIERPLLIYDTKFDIRQWFLVTNVYPLTVWMYRESYLRFCSQPFTLKNTHESIHLCNNAVQRKYKNGKRDRGLPDENMWDCYTFQTYLKAIGHPDAWEKYIYPGMKESFIGALLSSQDSMERKNNCFELYGADFMISDTVTDGPWLIEINSNPAMDSSTSVTARMCPQVLEDIIKVVIDRRDNKSAPTGAFEMVYKQNCPPIPPYLGMSLCIKGKKAYKSNGDSNSASRKSKSKNSTESLLSADTKEKSNEEVASAKGPEALQGNASPLCEEISLRADKQDGIKLNGSKRRKVDWVRKNIEDLKILNSSKHLKGSTSAKQNPKRKPEDESTGSNNKTLNPDREIELKKFLREALRVRNEIFSDDQTGKVLFVGGTEALKNEFYGDIILRRLSSCGVRSLIKFLRLHGQQIQITNETRTGLLEGTLKIDFSSRSKSCPNFSTKPSKENCTEVKISDESLDSFFSATSLSSSRNSKILSCESLGNEISNVNESEGELDARISKTFNKGVDEKSENVRNGEVRADRKKQKPNTGEILDAQKLELRGRSFESRHQLRNESNEKHQRHLA